MGSAKRSDHLQNEEERRPSVMGSAAIIFSVLTLLTVLMVIALRWAILR